MRKYKLIKAKYAYKNFKDAPYFFIGYLNYLLLKENIIGIYLGKTASANYSKCFFDGMIGVIHVAHFEEVKE